MHNYVLIFENESVIKELLDNKVARNSYDGSLFMMYGEKFNSVVPDKYNVAKVISPYADFSALLTSTDNENQLLIIGGK
jgi:hypothetical protein